MSELRHHRDLTKQKPHKNWVVSFPWCWTGIVKTKPDVNPKCCLSPLTNSIRQLGEKTIAQGLLFDIQFNEVPIICSNNYSSSFGKMWLKNLSSSNPRHKTSLTHFSAVKCYIYFGGCDFLFFFFFTIFVHSAKSPRWSLPSVLRFSDNSYMAVETEGIKLHQCRLKSCTPSAIPPPTMSP